MEGTEAKPIAKKSPRKLIVNIITVIMVLQFISMFPTVGFNGKRIWLFAPLRMTNRFMPLDIRPQGRFEGRVLGNYILETEFGDIHLRGFSKISAYDNRVSTIESDNFKARRASHNLVVDGIVIPKNITVAFDTRGDKQQITSLNILDQEIIFSGIPLNARIFFVNHGEYTTELFDGADRRLEIGYTPDYITLADSTQLSLVRFAGRLFMYNVDGIWKMSTESSNLMVKLPGETEFTRYKSITFKPNWGEFIEGELWE